MNLDIRWTMIVVFTLQAGLIAQQPASPTFSLLEWNIEAGGSDDATIGEQLKALEPFDILALSEVPQMSVTTFGQRWSKDAYLAGAAGGNARLLVAWNPQVFEVQDKSELKRWNDREVAPGIQPAPLVVQLRHRSSGQSFIVIMNHLARGSAELRKQQALLLCDWAGKQQLPVLAVGGFNFDYDFTKHQGNEAFDAFMATKTWKWIKPKEWVDSNWSDRNRDGRDDYPDSMLDYVFAAGGARDWTMTCEIVVRPGDFPDNDKTSDHRPVRCTVGRQ